MIAGLDCTEEEEARIWEFFESWSDLFKKRLREHGIPRLIDRYRALIERVVPGGRGYEFYSYTNELSKRDALHHLNQMAPKGLEPYLETITALDQKLRDCLVVDRFVFAEHARGKYPPEVFWYYYGLPANVHGA